MYKVSIIGLGLIGTSLGLALKKAGVEVEITGHDKERGSSNQASKMGATDKTEWNLIRAVEGARLVIIATPVQAIGEVMKQINSVLEEGCIVTDTGSTKANVLQWADEYLPRTVSFVGGHPLAGKEVSGPYGAEADLFQDAPYCILPSKHADSDAVKAVVHMTEIIGAKPYFIDPVEHDSYVGAVSHLPMVLSTMLVKVTSESPSWPEISRLASTGYRDISRLAAQDPEMNRDICLTNQEGLVYWIDEFIKELYKFRGRIKEGDASLFQTFDAAWEARDRWMQNKVTAPSVAPPVQTPTTFESMGGMILGDRAAGKVREIFDWYTDDKRRKGRR
ncbi:MAG: prephenate dehydrogenase/arogenate dehydrogenase family protein [Chloroflexi bacterium]|nr:prephenate dehydrogenase/arogenate dehydrogenase family protein [Chloroflexota bacterium]